MTKQLYVLLFCLFGSILASGQGHHEVHCITDEILADQIKSNPSLLAKQQASDAATLAYANSASKKSAGCDIRIIPCVFHIIHDNGTENISDETVDAYVKQVNDVFSFNNIDLNDLDTTWHRMATNMQIEMRLAQIDPDGNPTDGIVRVEDKGTAGAFDEIKELSRWDPDKYLNIWVVRTINYPGISGTVLGYAYFPFMEDEERTKSGIVIRSDVLNRATLPHELGHYLNLYHPFQGGCTTDEDCATAGDRVCDTPPMFRSTSGCPNNANTCTNNTPDLPDMIVNIMDYSSCRSILTHGQKDRVDAVLADDRAELVSIDNLYATGVIDSSYSFGKPIADFSADVIEICEGDDVEFSDRSCTDIDQTDYKWIFPSGVPSAAFTRDANVTYAKAGTYDATLIISNSSGADTLIKKALIKVTSAVSAIKAPFNSNFEDDGFPYDGWSSNAEGDETHWEITDKAARNGNSSLYIFNQSVSASDKEFTFSTPEIDLTTANVFQLNFDLAYARSSTTASERLEIYAVSTCKDANILRYQGSSFAMRTTDEILVTEFIPTSSQWQTVTVDLNIVRSFTSVSFLFRFVSNGDQNIYIDNLRIGDWAASVTETPAANLSLYPNPSTGTVKINGMHPFSDVNVNVRDLSGKLMMRWDGLKENEIDLSVLEKGMYLVEIETEKGNFTSQIIKQ